MDVICIEDEAFYKLIHAVLAHMKETQHIEQDKWISAEEAMKKLRITSKTTLQKLRDTGAIKFSQPEKKLILYNLESIYQYIESNVK